MFRVYWEQEIQQVRERERVWTIEQIIEPLRPDWPTILAELKEAVKKDYSTTRIGEVLAHEFNKIVEKMQKEHEKVLGNSRQWAQEREEEFQQQIKILKQEKDLLITEVRNLRRKNTNLEKQVHDQNIEIVQLADENDLLKGVQSEEEESSS